MSTNTDQLIFVCCTLLAVLVMSTRPSEAKVATASMVQDGSSSSSHIKDSPPFQGNFLIEDKCQFTLCGERYMAEWPRPGTVPVAGSCASDCSLLAITLNQNKFHKEFLWSSCADMCGDKYPAAEVPEYKSRQLSRHLDFKINFKL